MNEYTKVIEIERNADGDVVNHKESLIREGPGESFEAFADLRTIEANGRKFRLPLLEAVLAVPDAANLFRKDVRYMAFSAYANIPRTFNDFVRMQSSMREQEEYLRAAGVGVIPKAPSGTEAPYAQSTFEGGSTIVNNLHRMRFRVLGDWVRYDQIGKIRQLSDEMGRSARMTEENAVYSYITTSTNFTRNSTTSDNDVGANQASTTFNALGVDAAVTTIGTAKDRKSGAYLGYAADTFIAGPKMEAPAKQFFLSNDLQRAHGNTTAEVRGMGTYNPYQGLVSRLIISPWFGASYGWAMCDSRVMSLVYQEVEPFNVYQQTPIPDNTTWMSLDAIEYLVRGTFGVGFVDDRAWYLSTSTTAPTVS